jgi:hypothetical protein
MPVLPPCLRGPGKTIDFESPAVFLAENAARFPRLDPDFILQICFEHPDRFDRLFPLFDPGVHAAVRVRVSVGWVYEMVRYDYSEEPDFWAKQFDTFLREGEAEYSIFTSMVQTGTWPFPPVVVAAPFAAELGGDAHLGEPYHLVEGTHRVSYMRRMVQRGMLLRSSTTKVINLVSDAAL